MLIRILKAIIRFLTPKMEDMIYDEFSALERKKYRDHYMHREFF